MFEPAMKNVRATHIDFGFLRGLILSNPKVMPCNIDMVFERKGHFLFGEWKRHNENMSIGQEIVLVNLAKHPMNTVLIITGDTDDEARVTDIIKISSGGMFKQAGRSVEDLKNILNEWYQIVDKEE
jgi:hypothetical protein